MKNTLFRWQIAGFIFVAAAGTLLHYLYDWTGQSVLAAPFSGVNESTWEHMKLFFWPMFFFSFIESPAIKPDYPNFWCARLAGILAGLFLIPALFYTYTGASGTIVDWINISIFYLSAAIANLISGHVLRRSSGRFCLPVLSVAIICLLTAAFIIFTVFTPQIPLFRDPITDTYGLLR